MANYRMKWAHCVAVMILLGLVSPVQAQTLFRAVKLGKFNIPPANYSGIVHLAADSFAVVDDKSVVDGFHVFHISQNPETGKIERVQAGPLRGELSALSLDRSRAQVDCEDIAYVPQWNTFFIASEHLQEVFEYDSKGWRTGRKLHVPELFAPSRIRKNNGFESLTFQQQSGLFWLTTESALVADESDSLSCVRLQSFNMDLEPAGQWAYRMQPSELHKGLYYAHGISALLALDDGRLLVMERELTVPAGYLGAKTQTYLFMVSPLNSPKLDSIESLRTLPASQFLHKTELCHFVTHLKVGALDYANYEGLALGTVLKDGRQTLLLISDSQNGAGNAFYHLKDYLKVIVLPEKF